MAGPPDDTTEPEGVDASPSQERVRAAGHVLLAALAALVVAVIFFGLPVAYAAVAMAAIVVVAAVGPRRGTLRRAAAEARNRPPVWPDTPMKATVEAFPKAAFVVDASGVVRYANEQALRLFPATRPGDAFTLTFRWPEFAEAIELAEAGQQASVEFREPGEGSVTYSVTIGPVRSPGGRVNFLLVTFDDVSDRLADRAHARRLRRQCEPRTAHATRLAHWLHRDAARPGTQ